MLVRLWRRKSLRFGVDWVVRSVSALRWDGTNVSHKKSPRRYESLALGFTASLRRILWVDVAPAKTTFLALLHPFLETEGPVRRYYLCLTS